MRQFDEDRKVRTMLPECRVRRMPDALPAKNAAARLDLDPLGIKGMAAMTEPFGSELPGLATRAALQQESVFTQACPVRRGKTIGLGDWNRKAFGKISWTRLAAYNTASEPRMRLLTGVTIGPPITMATSLRSTWLVETPRTWRTASSTSSKPCT
jgi:hypothetical protein